MLGLREGNFRKKGGTAIRRPFTDIVYVSKRTFFLNIICIEMVSTIEEPLTESFGS